MPEISEVAQTAAAAVTDYKNLSIEAHAESVLSPLIKFTEDQVQQQLEETNQRTKLLQELETLSQNIRLAGGDMDWSANEEVKKLIDLARELGTTLPAGYVWPAAQASACIEGIKGTVDKLNNLNNKDEYRIRKMVDHISNLYMLLKTIASKADETKKFMLQR
ncbi:MAG: hypothetical protein ACI9S8_001132 [Chlamydiales bacterium]|jgi:hypothetical protein